MENEEKLKGRTHWRLCQPGFCPDTLLPTSPSVIPGIRGKRAALTLANFVTHAGNVGVPSIEDATTPVQPVWRDARISMEVQNLQFHPAVPMSETQRPG